MSQNCLLGVNITLRFNLCLLQNIPFYPMLNSNELKLYVNIKNKNDPKSKIPKRVCNSKVPKSDYGGLSADSSPS